MDSLSCFEALKRTVFPAAILIASPVCGLRPMRAARLETLNVPKPAIDISPSFFSPLVMVSKMASTASFAAFTVHSVCSRTTSTRVDLLIITSRLSDGARAELRLRAAVDYTGCDPIRGGNAIAVSHVSSLFCLIGRATRQETESFANRSAGKAPARCRQRLRRDLSGRGNFDEQGLVIEHKIEHAAEKDRVADIARELGPAEPGRGAEPPRPVGVLEHMGQCGQGDRLRRFLIRHPRTEDLAQEMWRPTVRLSPVHRAILPSGVRPAGRCDTPRP